MKRRKFITTMSGASAAAAAGAFSILKYPRDAQAAGWGSWPEDKLDALLDPSLRAHNVLELHVNGGMSCFDTFYTVPEWGVDDFRFLWTFSDERPDVGALGDNGLETRFEACGGAGLPLHVPFGAADTNGVELSLGPWAYPFRTRPDILDRMRIVVMRHGGVAHEAANPVSFTGTALGQPRMAGVGTAIQRYFNENIDAPGGGGIRAAPYAYVLYPAGYKPFNAVAASSVGFHPGSAKPLVVSVDPNSELSQLLARGEVDNEAFDRALDYYRSTYGARMRAFGHSADARSAERANYEFANFARRNAPELTEILHAELFAPIDSAACGAFARRDSSRMQLNMAANLLTRSSDAARYVMVIDAGLNPSPTGGHDVHGASVSFNGTNLPNTFQALLDVIATPEQIANGEADGMINLDETMVVINTEFGRTPIEQRPGGGFSTGTNHWPQGYVNIFLGGPISGRSVYGAITEAQGMAQTFVNPAENRMMVLQAMGIYPFSSQSYAVADVQRVEDELEGAARIRDTYLLGSDEEAGA